MLTIVLIALSTLVSEDLTCIATGVLIGQHEVSLAAGVLGCTVGILAGDLLLVVAGRYASLLGLTIPSVFDSLQHRPEQVLLWTRFTPGLRLPTYLGAGSLRLPWQKVVPALTLGSLLWTPLLVLLAALFGAAIVSSTLHALEAIVVMFAVWHLLKSYERRRRLQARLWRIIRWEFWPSWAIYLPLLPYLLWLAIRYRGLTVFTAANPGISTGGLVGESKLRILEQLKSDERTAARFTSVPRSLDADGRLQAVDRFMAGDALSYPIVLKPDAGERGTDVAIVRSREEVRSYLQRVHAAVIAQEYVPGEEFGVFYVRRPNEPAGRIVSITHKRLPYVCGDGVNTVSQLILRDRRAFILHDVYRAALGPAAKSVPRSGERVQLVQVGSHCRGAIFENASHLRTPLLEAVIDRVSQAHAGFYFGRYDLRAESMEALQRGEFKVLELNGVGAEPTHIYDPSLSIVEAYRTLIEHWRTAYEIGAANRDRGAAPANWRQIWMAYRSDRAA